MLGFYPGHWKNPALQTQPSRREFVHDPQFCTKSGASEARQSRQGNGGLFQQRDRHVPALLTMTNWVRVSAHISDPFST